VAARFQGVWPPLCNLTAFKNNDDMEGCRPLSHLVRIRNSQDFFFATVVKEWNIYSGSRVINATYFPWVVRGSFELAFDYETIAQPPYAFKFNPQVQNGKPAVKGDYSKATLIMLDRNEKPFRTVKGQKMDISIEELEFLAAGKSAGAQPSRLSDRAVTGGLDISITVTCHDRVTLRDLPKDIKPSLDNLLCLAKASVSARRFMSSDPSPNTINFELNGIRVVAKDEISYLQFVSLKAIYLGIAATIVFIEVPRKLVFIFATRMLGKLSKLYKEELLDHCSVSKVCAAWPVRLVHSAAIFHLIHTIKAHGWDKLARERPNITHRDFRKCLQACLVHDDHLEDDEIDNLSIFAIKELHADAVDDDLDLNFTEWGTISCALSSGASFGLIRDMLDMDRKMGTLEWLFRPPHLAKLMRYFESKRGTQISHEPSFQAESSDNADQHIRQPEAESRKVEPEPDEAVVKDQRKVVDAAIEDFQEKFNVLETKMMNLSAQLDARCAMMENVVKEVVNKAIETYNWKEGDEQRNPEAAPEGTNPVPANVNMPSQFSTVLADLQHLETQLSIEEQHRFPLPDFIVALDRHTDHLQKLLKDVHERTLPIHMENNSHTVLVERCDLLESRVHHLSAVFSGQLQEQEGLLASFEERLENFNKSFEETVEAVRMAESEKAQNNSG